jgi:hypothetical protein
MTGPHDQESVASGKDPALAEAFATIRATLAMAKARG